MPLPLQRALGGKVLVQHSLGWALVPQSSVEVLAEEAGAVGTGDHLEPGTGLGAGPERLGQAHTPVAWADPAEVWAGVPAAGRELGTPRRGSRTGWLAAVAGSRWEGFWTNSLLALEHCGEEARLRREAAVPVRSTTVQQDQQLDRLAGERLAVPQAAGRHWLSRSEGAGDEL